MRTMATYRLGSDEGLTSAAVTALLGLDPTESFEAGTPVSTRSETLHEASGWLLSSGDTPQHGIELSEQIERVLALLEPVESQLWQLVGEGYLANWFCYVESHLTEHAVELDRALLTRILRLPGDLWLDVCGDGVDES